MSLLAWCQWLQNMPLSTAIRTSGYSYPLIEGSHVLGLAFSVGTIVWFDLRLLGVTMRRDRVSDVFNQLRPWATVGFVIMVATGSLLFASRAADAYASTYFRIKIGLLTLGANQYGYPISEKAVLEERWERPSPNRLRVQMTLTDPMLYQSPWKSSYKVWTLIPKDKMSVSGWSGILEDRCVPSDESLFNQFRDHAAGLKK